MNRWKKKYGNLQLRLFPDSKPKAQSPKKPFNLSLLLPPCDKDVWTRPGLHETHDIPIRTPLFRHSEPVRKPSLYKIDNTENRLLDTGREGDGGTNWESSIETYTLPYVKLDSQGEFAVWCRELKPCAHWQPRGWEGVGRGGREVQDGGDICIPVADSCCCMAETNTTL